MSRLCVPSAEEVAADTQDVLDKVGAQLGFVPNMFKALASNPAVLDVVTTLQGQDAHDPGPEDPGTPSR